MLFIVVNRDKNRPVLGEQFSEQAQARVHHAAPFVVSGEVFPVNGHVVFQPLANHGRVHVVRINPAFVAGIVRRVNVDAADAPGVVGQEGFEGEQVVAL